MKHDRELLPPARVKSVVDCIPKGCRRCGQALHGIDGAPLIHQVLDIPRLIAYANEYRRHRLRCTDCGITTVGPLPEGAPATGMGPRFEALLGVLSGKHRLSKLLIQDLCADVFDINISTRILL